MKIALRTFGCRANQYDSASIREALEAAGAEVVPDTTSADVMLFNSCTVTAAAEAELRTAVRRAARERPGLRTVIIGCAAAVDRGALRSLPTVTDVIGGADATEVLGALGLDAPAGWVRGARQQQDVRALLRIQDGCDEHCTFCATTRARGASRSRAPDELVAEAAALAERHPEIVLTGIHIGSYGRDLGTSLGALVERLLRGVPRVRFRLSSVEATEVDDRLAELLRDAEGRVAPHLHAPLQSGADRVLRRMGRHWYTAASYAEAVERLVDGRPVFGLGADVIAGFPGETEEEHQATLALVERLPFTYLHVFPYSPRPGTPAERLGPAVPPDTVRRRAAELRALADRKAAAYRAARAGGRADLVVVGRGDRRSGLTEDYLSVMLADSALPRGTRLTARLAPDGDRLVAHPLQPHRA